MNEREAIRWFSATILISDLETLRLLTQPFRPRLLETLRAGRR